MKTAAFAAISFFGLNGLAAPVLPYEKPSGTAPPNFYTMTAYYPTGTASSYSGAAQCTESASPYYPYPTGGYSYAPSGYATGYYPTASGFAHASTVIGSYPSKATGYPAGTQTILPEIQVQWRKDTPRAKGNTPFGLISKRNGAEDTNTAVRFSIPQSYFGKTCKLSFQLSFDAESKWVSKPERRSSFELYTLQGELSTRNSWSDRVVRGEKIATVTPKIGQAAEYEEVLYPQSLEFPCVEGSYSYEMAPAGNDAHIAWKTTEFNMNGLVMEVY